MAKERFIAAIELMLISHAQELLPHQSITLGALLFIKLFLSQFYGKYFQLWLCWKSYYEA
jgi:hypothetical protein